MRIGRRKGFDALTDAILDRTAFADPGPLRFGSASRTMDFVRGFTHLAEDLSLFKDTWIGQKLKVRFQTQVANAFNRVVFLRSEPQLERGLVRQGVFAVQHAPVSEVRTEAGLLAGSGHAPRASRPRTRATRG